VILIASVLTGPMSRPEGCTASFALFLLLMGLVVAFAGMHIRVTSRPNFSQTVRQASNPAPSPVVLPAGAGLRT
jgi:hypothetical protein